MPADGGPQSEATFAATFILGGQIRGGRTRLFLIYPEGNFIEATDDNPFFQIGEHKYGKPILVRAYDRQMSFEKAAKLLLVSFNSTLKSNISVGLPLDMQVYENDALRRGFERRLTSEDPYYRDHFRGLVGGAAHRLRQPAGLQLRLTATPRQRARARWSPATFTKLVRFLSTFPLATPINVSQVAIF